MEIVAIAKTGVHIYSIADDDSSGNTGEPVASLPPAGSAFGYAWSHDGSKIATCDQGKAMVWDAENKYKQLLQIDGIGESGGARALRWSPRGSFLTTFAKHEKDKCPENMHVWDLRGTTPELKRSVELRSYQSGAPTADLIQWAPDESICLELVAGEGIVVLDGDLKAGETHRVIPEVNAAQFSIAPAPQNDGFYVSMYIPEAANAWGAWDLEGRAGEVVVYHVSSSSDEIKKISFQALTRKLNSCTMHWNFEGTALLAFANSDVDETGTSYFGTSSVYWIKADGKSQCRVCGPEDGLVQDLAWSPGSNEFMMIIGMMPATTKLYDGKTGKMLKEGNLGTSRRNTIRWNPFGRFVCVGGFGALPGDLDFFDNSSKETLCSFRAALTVNCSWGPSGRHFLTCTTAPRMNEDNQISIWHYNTGEKIVKLDFSPQGALRTGGGSEGGRAAADAGAMLFAASWRPDGVGDKQVFKDRAASPPPKGVKRTKGLKVDDLKTKEGGGAYRPKGGEGFSGVAAMMRGELAVPTDAPSVGGGWDLKGDAVAPAKPLTWQEQEQQAKDWAKEKKALAKKEKAEVEEAKQAIKDETKALADKIKGGDKKLADLKAQLANMDKLKDKEWDELTEEDEAELEQEIEIKALIAELEKGK